MGKESKRDVGKVAEYDSGNCAVAVDRHDIIWTFLIDAIKVGAYRLMRRRGLIE